MIKNVILSYFRSLLRNKTTAFINLFGLSIGLASCFIIMLFVIGELNMDHFQKNRKSIYRVITENKNHNMIKAEASFLFGPAAKSEFPEVKNYCRMLTLGPIKVKKDNQWIEEKDFHFADPSVFDFLTFNFTGGNATEAIADANTIAISEHTALKIFGNKDVIGKTLLVSIKGEEQILTVKAIFTDLPENSSINVAAMGNLDFGKKNLVKMLINYSSDGQQQPTEWKDSWDHTFYTNLLYIPEKTDIEALENKINKTFKKYQAEEDNMRYTLQRYDKIYLHSGPNIIGSTWKSGKLSNIYVFSATALLILLIACFNYMILSLAQSGKRAREIGIRKTNGADFQRLLKQILLESAMLTTISLPVAIGLTELLLPFLNSLLEKNLVINYSQNLIFVAGIVIIIMTISLVSGFYLAIYLNKFNPIEILRGQNLRSGVHSPFLKSLVILQITIFIALIISSTVIFKQLAFVTNYHPGIDAENVLTIKMSDVLSQKNYQVLKQELTKIPGIKSVSACLFMPPTDSKMSMQVQRMDDSSKPAIIEVILVDYNFIETLGLTIKEGRSFSEEFLSDQREVILNESGVEELGLKEPIGAKTPIGKVVGVVNDFHVHDLHSKVTPAYLALSSQFFAVAIKTKTNAPALIPKIKTIWDKVNPDTRFECELLTNQIEAQYHAEQKLSKIILLFTVIAILIAALGLFGLSSFITQQRTKEIGIRKVNGGTLSQMIFIFWREILTWAALAFLIACPLAWYVMHRWLENFAYRTVISWWIFALAGITALFIALLAVSWQAYRAASRNPVVALRYE